MTSSIATGPIPRLCTDCRTRPCLGALGRCAVCQPVAGEDNLQSRAAAAARVAKRKGESEHRHHEVPQDRTKSADRSQKRPPKYKFGREKRSLGNGSKRR